MAPIHADNNVTIDNTTLIQDTIDEADDGDVVYLNPGTYHESGININKNITFQGLGELGDVVIDGGQNDSIISINKKVTVSLNNISFINGKSDTYGGAVFTRIAESVHISNCIFENNTAVKDGGALYIESKFNPNPREFFYGYLEVDNCSFINNHADSGGAVATCYADSDIKNSEFISNYANDFGGALSFVNGIFTVSSSKFENNYADYDGGVIRQNMESKLYIEDSQFINNSAKEWGGVLYNWLGELTVKNSIISNNTAGIRGGGIFTAGPLTVVSSQISDNDAGYGGALYVFQEFYSIEPIVTFNNNIITGNTAVKEGDLVYYLLLTYVRSDYENNYWGDINPNSTQWAEKFVTNEYTGVAPKTWLEKHPEDIVENTTSKNEKGTEKATNLKHNSGNEKSTFNSIINNAVSSNQNSGNEKPTTDSVANNAVSLNQNSGNGNSTTNFKAGNSTRNMTSPGQDSKSASYLTKKNQITKPPIIINNTYIVLAALILTMWGYGLYRFRK